MPSPALPPDMEGAGVSQPPPQRTTAKGPTTFADMGIGIQGVKLEQKVCVIMCLAFFVLSCQCIGIDLLRWVDFSFT
jgi:hypothetical protein